LNENSPYGLFFQVITAVRTTALHVGIFSICVARPQFLSYSLLIQVFGQQVMQGSTYANFRILHLLSSKDQLGCFLLVYLPTYPFGTSLSYFAGRGIII